MLIFDYGQQKLLKFIETPYQTSCFRPLSKAIIFQPYMSQHDFGRDEHYNFHVFDRPYRRSLESSETVKSGF